MAITYRILHMPDGETLFRQIDDSDWGSIIELEPDDKVKALPPGIYDTEMRLIEREPDPEEFDD